MPLLHVARRTHRRGQALVEFAIVAFVLTFLVGAMLAVGLLLFGANVVQQAADVGAQELARLPLPDTVTSFDAALADPQVSSQIYDERYLVVDLERDLAPGQTVDDFFASKPLVNRLLRPAMVVDIVDLGNGPTRALRYPGALARNASGQTTVVVPVVTGRNADGVETLAWRKVLEEVVDPKDLTGTPFSQDIISLRINYPYQSAALVAVRYEDAGGTPVDPVSALSQDVFNRPVVAADDQVSVGALPGGYTLITNASVSGTYAGAYGLGVAHAFTTQVRPYRKLVSMQGVYPRQISE